MTTSASSTTDPARLGVAGRLAVLGIWLGLGLLESAKAYVSRTVTGGQPDLVSVVVGNLPWWLAWAAFTPLVVHMARTFLFEDGRLRAASAHLTAAVVLSLLHHLLVGVLFYLTNTRGSILPMGGRLIEMTPLRQFQLFFSTYFVLNVLTYAAVLAAYLGFQFYRRYRAGELRAARLEADMHLARLEALRMELNPHFLFNSLNAVAGLVRIGQNGAAVEMLARLGRLLRTTLARDGDLEVELERELELLRVYLEIEEVRFGGRLTVDFDVEEATRRAAVPPLLLQPLAENAIRHGIARRPGPGRLTVSARSDDASLVLAVRDTGSGEAANGPVREEDRSGVGLANVRSRLAELYGSSAGLTLEADPEGGTVATVRIPSRQLGPRSFRSSPAAATPGTSDSP